MYVCTYVCICTKLLLVCYDCQQCWQSWLITVLETLNYMVTTMCYQFCVYRRTHLKAVQSRQPELEWLFVRDH